MNPELLLLQRDARITALEDVVGWLTAAIGLLLSVQSPDVSRVQLEAIEARLRQHQRESLRAAAQGLPPEKSALVAGEYEEILARVLPEIIGNLRRIAAVP